MPSLIQVSDVLTISGLEEGSEVAVFDLSGKLVSQMRSMNEIERLDVNAFENGIYYIRVTQWNSDSISENYSAEIVSER